jgi:hypothetical protein
MQTPAGELGRSVEAIMARLKPHLKEDDSGTAVHYNRAYEAVTFELERFQVRLTAYNVAIRGNGP